ncbi:hypothetical protein BD779DRAFT_1469775 [Infundibulicybe gibba]|nr:hypothetical protein BD779DRAFT_1469775 [Infundibulicybe gibba]
MSRMNTRPGNKNAHPGIPDLGEDAPLEHIPKTRTQIKAIADAKKLEKAETERVRAEEAAAIHQTVQALELSMAAVDKVSRETAARPKPKAVTKSKRIPATKAKEPEFIDPELESPEPEPAELEPDLDPEAALVTPEPGLTPSTERTMQENISDDILNKIFDAGLDEAERLELEMDGNAGDGDEPEPTKANKVAKGKSRELVQEPQPQTLAAIRRRIAQSGVRAEAGTRSATPDPPKQPGQGKRKASSSLVPKNLPKKGRPSQLSGLVSDWRSRTSKSIKVASEAPRSEDEDSPPPTQPHKRQPSGASRAPIPSKASTPDPFGYAGYVDSDEDDIVEATRGEQGPSKRSVSGRMGKMTQSLAKVNARLSGISSRSSSNVSTPTRERYLNHSLPDKCHEEWRKKMVPSWIQLSGLATQPWFIDLAAAQTLWDTIFPENPQTLEATGEPIFSVLKQRTYEWRSQFAMHATVAVEAFWKTDSAFADADERAAYVQWAIPVNTDDPTPFTWASVEENEGVDTVYKGDYQAPAVIATFALHHLAAVSVLPDKKANPIGALAMAATARIDSRGWRKIMERAKAVLERGKKAILPPNMSANQILPKPDSRRYKVVDADTSD